MHYLNSFLDKEHIRLNMFPNFYSDTVNASDYWVPTTCRYCVKYFMCIIHLMYSLNKYYWALTCGRHHLRLWEYSRAQNRRNPCCYGYRRGQCWSALWGEIKPGGGECLWEVVLLIHYRGTWEGLSNRMIVGFWNKLFQSEDTAESKNIFSIWLCKISICFIGNWKLRNSIFYVCVPVIQIIRGKATTWLQVYWPQTPCLIFPKHCHPNPKSYSLKRLAERRTTRD